MPGPTSSREAWTGRWLRVEVENWPQLGEYEVVRKHDAAGVIPVTPDGDVLMVRQLRPVVRDTLVEIPAGLLDIEREDALSCAARELHEETGYRHDEIEFLGGFYTSAGFTDEYVHLFWARTKPEPEGAPERGIEVIREPLPKMVEAARAGRVRDAKTALALLLAAGRESVG